MKNKAYNSIKEYQSKFPALTFDNNGYEYLSMEVQEKYAKEIQEISDILKEVIDGFVKFNNFKPRKDGSLDIRHQCYWDASFIGVDYLPIEELKVVEQPPID